MNFYPRQQVAQQIHSTALVKEEAETARLIQALPKLANKFSAEEFSRLVELRKNDRITSSLKDLWGKLGAKQSGEQVGAVGELRGYMDAIDRRGYQRVEVLPDNYPGNPPEARLFKSSGEVNFLEVKTADVPPKIKAWEKKADAANKKFESVSAGSGEAVGETRLDFREVDIRASDRLRNQREIEAFVAGRLPLDDRLETKYLEVLWKKFDDQGNFTVMRTFRERTSGGLSTVMTVEF